jgi:hypothetical protein
MRWIIEMTVVRYPWLTIILIAAAVAFVMSVPPIDVSDQKITNALLGAILWVLLSSKRASDTR